MFHDLFSLSSSERLWVWGVFSRCLALHYFFAIAQLLHQVNLHIGRKGLNPIHLRLQRIKADFGYRAIFYFPSVFWINSSDASIYFVTLLGAGSALTAAIGGFYSPACLFVAWTIYLSLAEAMTLVFPWDDLLLESGFLSLFLPQIPCMFVQLSGATDTDLLIHRVLDKDYDLRWKLDWSAAAVPAPLIAFAFRYLFFRLMFGFGKLKFTGVSWRDFSYLHGFFIAMPLPNPLGWYAHFLPVVMLKASLVIMFITEIPIPVCMLLSSSYRVVAGLATMALQIGINATGNFGFFNTLSFVMCVPLFDTGFTALPTELGLGDVLAQALQSECGFRTALFYVIFPLLLFPCSLVCLLFNSWMSRAWMFYPTLQALPFTQLYRCIAPFRLVHAFGIFLARCNPPMRLMPVIEGSADGETWQTYEYAYQTCHENSRPSMIAPYHHRFDYYFFYLGLGATRDNFSYSFFEGLEPYMFSRSTFLLRIVHQLLHDDEGDLPVSHAFKTNPFLAGKKAPRFVRVRQYNFTPCATPGSKAWWHKDLVSTLVPASAKDDPRIRHAWALHLPDTTLFHPELHVWRHRSPYMQSLVRAYRRTMGEEAAATKAAGSTEAALLAAAPHAEDVRTVYTRDATLGLDVSYLVPAPVAWRSEEVRSFWTDLIGLISNQGLHKWNRYDDLYTQFKRFHHLPHNAYADADADADTDVGMSKRKCQNEDGGSEATGRKNGGEVGEDAQQDDAMAAFNQWRRFERMLGSLTNLFVQYAEPLYFYPVPTGTPRLLPVRSFLTLTLLAHQLILQGKTKFETALAAMVRMHDLVTSASSPFLSSSPSTSAPSSSSFLTADVLRRVIDSDADAKDLVSRVRVLNDAPMEGMSLLALFWPEVMRDQIRTYRLLSAFGMDGEEEAKHPVLPGMFHVIPLLSRQAGRILSHDAEGEVHFVPKWALQPNDTFALVPAKKREERGEEKGEGGDNDGTVSSKARINKRSKKILS